MAKRDQVTALDKSVLLRGPFAGTISSLLMRDVERAIRRAIEVPAP